MFYSEAKPCSALLIAAYRGYKDIVELLVAAGASVHVVDGSGETPLHKASSEGHRDVVELLITNGAQIDAEAKDGCTSLYLILITNCNPISLLWYTNFSKGNSISFYALLVRPGAIAYTQITNSDVS